MALAVRQFAVRTHHHEAMDWASRVITAGGTFTTSTLAAVSQFCRDIETAGMRDRFYRLNLMCGSDLTACLVPLYRNTSFAGSVLGNTTDTNNNFVSGDYNETGSSTGGLKGNGSTKYLATGVNPVTISATNSDFHLCLYAAGAETTGTSRGYMGTNLANGLAETFLGLTSGGSYETAAISSTVRVNGMTGSTQGFFCVTTNGNRTQNYYLNASAAQTATGSGSFFSAGCDIFRAGNFYALAKYGRGYSIGLGLTSTQVADLRTALAAFNDMLARKV